MAWFAKLNDTRACDDEFACQALCTVFHTVQFSILPQHKSGAAFMETVDANGSFSVDFDTSLTSTGERAVEGEAPFSSFCSTGS